MARSKSTPQNYVFALVTQGLRGPGDKYPSHVEEGRTYAADWPIVLANPDCFSTEPTLILPRNWVPPVEQATAAPGELRDSRRAD